MEGRMIKITRIGARFNVDIGDSRFHVLNEKSLKWNLKHRFGVKGLQMIIVFEALSQHGYVEIGAQGPVEEKIAS
jgi:hypothetical protein